ncbi:RHS repeat-associated core domain-containing protein [Streptomyces sp. MK7]|uniref:RHS repeat-associated core domain-containing protein n=1 Tax=Streptomyces sp. MK7 TaxID=3067635 RepID=UPI00292DBBEC|nr:RHS repeat-associated core domain-containing protein [Streptomyces sp. MK7]
MSFGIDTSRWRRAVGRRRTGRLLGQSLALALIVPTGLAQVAQAAESGGLGRPDVPDARVSKVKEFEGPGAKKARQKVARDKKANAAQAEQANRDRKTTWPKQSKAALTLTRGHVSKADPGGVPLTLIPQPGNPTAKRASGAKKQAVAGGTARISVLDQKAARKAGVTGVLLTADADTAGTAEVGIDYSSFASAIGGGWSQRLRLVELPACALTTPGRPECRTQQPLTSDNDTARQTVSATVDLAAASSGPSEQLLRSADGTAPATTVLAVTAAASGSGQSPSGTGSYSATPLSPSSSWQAGGNSGSFTWSYDFTLPPAAAGPVPPLSLSYDSGSIDGRTATTNNQGTPVGEGFTLTESYIERSYNSCDDDGHDGVFDQCWKYDNARLVLNGKSTRLIKDKDSGEWHLEDDDASKVTRSTGADNGDNDGEYWTVITGDGTKYVFGLNKLDGATTQRTNSTWTVPVFGDDSGEPGYTAGDTFGDRALTQAWRWNLDYVEDTHGNAATYWYTAESNYYKKNKSATADASYTRGGYLGRIEYGLRKGALFTDKADAKVIFTYSERCTAADCSSLTKDTADNWPDVPFDAICSKDDSDCNAAGPSFFTRKRLIAISTFSYNATSNAYDTVDAWVLTQAYLDGGDIGDSSDQVLTLSSITRWGKTADPYIHLNPVSFTYQERPNRVDATDDILPLTRPRISTITSETGAITTVTLSAPECKRSEVLDAPQDTNTRSCYPQYWHINGAATASVDWFHKYRVLAVLVSDPAANNQAVEYAYDYSGAAWHYNDDPFTPKDERTWSDWRGYRQVTAWTGATAVTRSKTVSLYMQGMHGDKNKDGTTKSVSIEPLLDTDVDFGPAYDSDRYKGVLRQQVTYNGSQPISSVFKSYVYKQTATQTVPDADPQIALWVHNSTTYTSTYLTASKSWRSRGTIARYDDLGMVTALDDYGQVGKGGDETCTRTWYARNADLGITGLVSRTRTVAKQCSTVDTSLSLPATTSTRGDVLADAATVYDTPTATAWSATQKPTKGEVSWTGRATGYATTADLNGDRMPTGWQTVATSTYDALGRPLSTTDAAGHTASTVYTPTDSGPLTQTIASDPKQYHTVTFLDPRRGLALRTYDANSKKTELNYDALGRLTEVWLPNRIRGSQAPNTTFAYHLDKTNPSWVSTSTLKKDGDTYNTSYALYDALLRPLQTQTPTPQGGRLLTDTRYDTRGLAYQTYADIFDNTSTPNGTYTRAEYGEAPTQTETVFDGAGRPTTSTLYVFGVKKWSTSTSYTGDSVATTALEGGSAQRTITDIRDQTTESRQYASASPADSDFGTGPGASYTSTTFSYALDGQQNQITGSDGAKWTYGYDLFGRQTSTTDPDRGTTTTAYNTLDQVIKSTDSRSTSILTDYDELGRPTGTWNGSKTDANQLTGYTYDTLLKGLPTSSTRYVGGKTGAAYTTTVAAYDSLNRATGTQLQLPDSDPFVKAGQPSTLPFETYYNIDGTQQYTKEPALGGLESEIVGFKYDDLGDLINFGGSTGYLLDVSYSALGQPEQLTLGVGGPDNKSAYITNRYEAGTGRLLRSHVTDQTHPYMLQDLNYIYDQAGNVTAISDPTTLGGTSSAETQCLAYDGHQRLTEAWTPASQKCTDTRSATSLSGPGPYWTSYTYNTAGQRLTETQHKSTGDTKTTYCYTKPTQPHTLTGATTKTDCTTPERVYAYDTTGNTTTRPGTSGGQNLTWSPEGKLSKLTEAGTSTNYIYDADGSLLIRATDNGERILYAGATELHLRANGTTWAQRYYAAGGITAAFRSNESGTNKLTYLTGDHHGTSTLALTWDTQAYTKRYTTPFGEERGKPQYGPWPDDKGFLGKTRDANTGLTHIGAREYDPVIGQFLSVDPLLTVDDAQSLNGYSYADNNPATLSDPSGLMGCATPIECGGGTQLGNNTPTRNSGGKALNDPSWGCNGCDGNSYDDNWWTTSGWSSAASGPELSPGKTTVFPGVAVPSDWDGIKEFKQNLQSDLGTAYCGLQCVASWITNPDDSEQLQGGQQSLALAKWRACGLMQQHHCPKGVGSFKDALSAMGLIALETGGGGGRGISGNSGGLRGRAGGSCLHSFVAGTEVLLADGTTKGIEDVRAGDEVTATDPATGKTTTRKVIDTIVTRDDKEFVDLTVSSSDPSKAEGSVIATTTHPFWSPSEAAWVDAGSLRVGMTLRTANGHTVQVSSARHFTRQQTTHDLTIEGIHTYYVLAGQTPVLVHNSGGCLPALRNWSSQRFQFGNQSFLLDKKGMEHILTRHHPNYWDGSVKKTQSFFDSSMSVDDVQDAIGQVMRQNRDTLVQRGSQGMYQIRGNVNGVDYVLGMNRGRVGQFYPESP